jgi:hypothetical protein
MQVLHCCWGVSHWLLALVWLDQPAHVQHHLVVNANAIQGFQNQWLLVVQG